MSTYPEVAGAQLASDPNLAALLEQLRERHHDAVCGVLLYGSCLRSGNIYDGLLDLYLICDDYRTAYSSAWLSATNWLLPPNVFYAEHNQNGQTLRSKVTVISLRDFRRGCSTAWFQSYIWGRFAQPTRILYSRDETSHNQLEDCLQQAVRTMLLNSLPALPQEGKVSDLWKEALGLSYATELRTERKDRANELAQSAQEFYATLTPLHCGSLGFPVAVYDVDDELHYRSLISAISRKRAGLAWAMRRGQGKLMSIMRLVKALFTFEGGLDYIAWKLERHSGEEVVIPDKVRRAPLIYLWGFFWGLYRRGIFK